MNYARRRSCIFDDRFSSSTLDSRILGISRPDCGPRCLAGIFTPVEKLSAFGILWTTSNTGNSPVTARVAHLQKRSQGTLRFNYTIEMEATGDRFSGSTNYFGVEIR